MRAQEVYDALFPQGHPQRDAWPAEQLRARGLEAQHAARVAGGWNVELAARAQRFHQESQEIARSGAWADKAYVFYSISPEPTTLRVHLERVSEAEFAGPIDLLKDEHIPTLRFLEGDVEPPRSRGEQTLEGDRDVPALILHQWTRANGRCRKVVWRVWGENKESAGDGTVPLESLKGFGGRAHEQEIAGEKETNAPHAKTPKDDGLWRYIMKMMQGTWVPTSSGR